MYYQKELTLIYKNFSHETVESKFAVLKGLHHKNEIDAWGHVDLVIEILLSVFLRPKKLWRKSKIYNL